MIQPFWRYISKSYSLCPSLLIPAQDNILRVVGDLAHVARAQEGSGLGAGGEQLPARGLRLRRGAGPRQEGAERRPQRRPGLRGQTSCKISNELFVCFIGKSDNPSKTINILKMLFSMEPSSG